jgi:putative two-component system response regulator
MQFIEDAIINKPGPLNEREVEKMRNHTVLGFQHLGRHCFYKGLVTIVALQHHERWDGTGYTQKLAGNDIHEYSRIVAVADFLDAFTSDRPYRTLQPLSEALDYIRSQSNKEFDPRVVKHLLHYFRVPDAGSDDTVESFLTSEMEDFQ